MKIRKEDIKNYYCSTAFTNTLLIVMLITFIYCFSVTTTSYKFKRYLRINEYDYSSEIRETTIKLNEIKKAIEDNTDSNTTILLLLKGRL